MRHAIARSKERGAGYVYVTPGALPNPWNQLPGHGYWPAEQETVA
jgi:hypothetical protein